MNILIFGSNGFIGKYLNENFKISGHNVFTIGLSPNNNISIDLSKYYFPITGEYDYVIHCSGLVHSEKHSYEIDNALLINDVNITINLLKSLKNTIFKKFIYISSVSVYGLDIGDNISVNSEINPISGYAISKIISENIIKNSISDNQLLILRLPLVNGPNPKGNIKKLIDQINSNLMIVFKNNRSKKSILDLSDLFFFILNDSSKIIGTHLIKSYDIYFNLFVESIALQQNKKLIYLPLIILKFAIFLSNIFRIKKINILLMKINNNLTFEPSLSLKKNK
jgi:nucleoside-diphosphate-sugar epimerase